MSHVLKRLILLQLVVCLNITRKKFVASGFKCHDYLVLLSEMGQMGGTGCDNLCRLNRDNSSIGMADKSGKAMVGIRVGSGVCNGSGNSVSGKVGSLCGNNLRGLGGDNGTIGMCNKGTGVVVRVSSGVSVPSCIPVWVSDKASSTSGSKVSSLSSLDLRGLGGGNSTVGVGDKVDSGGSSHASKENLKIEFFLV